VNLWIEVSEQPAQELKHTHRDARERKKDMSIRDLPKIGFLAREGFEDWKIEDICRALARIGYQAVEWSHLHFRPREMAPAELRRLVSVPADFGLTANAAGVPADYIVRDERARRQAIERTSEAIAAAGDAGICVLSVYTGPVSVRIPEEMSEGTAWQMVFDAFDQILPAAEAQRVSLAVEAACGMLAHDYYTTLPLFQRYASDWLGINMDPSHCILYRNDIPWSIRQWGSRIKHVHVKDAVGRPGRHGDTFIFPLLGEGLVDWPAFFAALREVDYAGICSTEFESFAYLKNVLKGDILAAARLSWEQLQTLLRTA